jgi:hypothetical protein
MDIKEKLDESSDEDSDECPRTKRVPESPGDANFNLRPVKNGDLLDVTSTMCAGVVIAAATRRLATHTMNR